MGKTCVLNRPRLLDSPLSEFTRDTSPMKIKPDHSPNQYKGDSFTKRKHRIHS